MQGFKDLAALFDRQFEQYQFPAKPDQLYNGVRHILSLRGKRIRPVLLLMAHEMFEPCAEDALHAAIAIELFHNFSLIHDDIMDKAPLRRGKDTVHALYGESTALLAGDVMLVAAYESLGAVRGDVLPSMLRLFNKTAREVCEGQQQDIDFEQRETVSVDEYIEMITKKTSVLLGCSLQMGALIGGAGITNQERLFAFGKNLGIAFQVQDDYLDVFGDPEKFGKQTGGDIIANKKTFLLLHALQSAADGDKQKLQELMRTGGEHKVEQVLEIYKRCKAGEWALELKQTYFEKAMKELDEVAVVSLRKKELESLARSLMDREH